MTCIHDIGGLGLETISQAVDDDASLTVAATLGSLQLEENAKTGQSLEALTLGTGKRALSSLKVRDLADENALAA